MTSMLTLFCYIVGEESPFSIRIPSSETVDDLKNAIKERKSNGLKHIDANELRLYQISLPYEGDLMEKMQDALDSAVLLSPVEDLVAIFPQPPPRRIIHILVELPDDYLSRRSHLALRPEAAPHDVALSSKPRKSSVTDHSYGGSVLDSRRPRTVSGLYERLLKYTFILVRGTPASGKTTLAELLAVHIRAQEPDTQIIRISFWPFQTATDPLSARNFLAQTYGWVQETPMVLILDEAQTSYNDSSLWVDFIKILSRFRCRVVAFASYGSPSVQLNMTGTHILVEDIQRVSLWPVDHDDGLPAIGLLFTQEEFDDLVSKRWPRERYYFDPSFFQGVFEFTAGHAGAIHDFVTIISAHDSYRRLKNSGNPLYTWDLFEREIRPNELGRLLERYPLTSKRGLPRRTQLRDPHIADIFLTVLRNRVAWSTDFTSDDTRSALLRCYHNGWLHSERIDGVNQLDSKKADLLEGKDLLGGVSDPSQNVGFIFPSPFHRWYLEWMLTNVFKPQFEGTNLLDFVLDALSNFSPLNFATERRINYTWIQSVPEAQFQDEFYRCCSVCSNGSVGTFPEYGMKKGRVDFYIPAKNWGIELLREGSRLTEHCHRFSQSGSYGSTLSLSDYIILDCRVTEPTKTHTNLTKLYHVIFTDNFRNVTVRDNALKLITEYRLLNS